MREIEVIAPAKVNLFLETKYKREDGYWELDTVFQTLEWGDRLVVRESSDFRFSCSWKFLENRENLVVKAVELMRGSLSVDKGVDIYLEKKIPAGSGLGGGSSDAAAVMKALNVLWDLNLGMEKLKELSSCLGSDVSFFIEGGTCQGKGRGEIIKPLSPLPSWEVFLLIFPFPLFTTDIYASLKPPVNLRDSRDIIQAIRKKSQEKVIHFLFNRLEEVVLREVPFLKSVKKELQEQGWKTLVSGSGPTLFGLIKKEEEKDCLREWGEMRGVDIIFTRIDSRKRERRDEYGGYGCPDKDSSP